MDYRKIIVHVVTGVAFLTLPVLAPKITVATTDETESAATLVNVGKESLKVEAGDIVWSEQDVTGQQIYFSTFENSKSAWSEPVRISNDGYHNGLPVIDEDQRGRRLVVWTAGSGDDYQLRFSVNSGKSWSEPESMPLQMKVNLAPSVAMDTAGVPWLVWSANNGGQDEIYYARYTKKEWSVPKLVNEANEVPDIMPDLTLGDDGVMTVTWQGFRNGAYVQLQSSWDGSAWTPEVMEETTKTASNATVAGSTTTKVKSTETTAALYGTVTNMPSFVADPEHAYLRVYKSSVVKTK
jgi:hypothetical protein